ncbi:Solute carrier family 35 member G1 [Halotydeus destructor]|nr:Solute carrier family 35 member G1 [Halotydeus destructor]
MSGVLLIARPTFIFGDDGSVTDGTYRTIGTIMSFVSSISGSLTFVMMRKLKKTPIPVVIAWFSILSISMGAIILTVIHLYMDQRIKLPTEFTVQEWLLLLCNGLCGVVGQFGLTTALKIEEASVVALVRTTDILVAFVYQVSFLNEAVQWTSLLGVAIVMFGVLVSGVRRILSERSARAMSPPGQPPTQLTAGGTRRP